jgi:hypothetical protein
MCLPVLNSVFKCLRFQIRFTEYDCDMLQATSLLFLLFYSQFPIRFSWRYCLRSSRPSKPDLSIRSVWGILPEVCRFEIGASIGFFEFAPFHLQQYLANRGLPSYLVLSTPICGFFTSALICSFTREESVALTPKEALPLLKRLVAWLSPPSSGFWVNLCGKCGGWSGIRVQLKCDGTR